MREWAQIAGAIVIAAYAALLDAQTVTSSDVAIRQLLDRWEKAFRAKDVEAVMKVYAPGAHLIAFDVAAPLQRVGPANFRKSYDEFFAMYEGPLDVERRDLRINFCGDVAFIHALERMSGTLKGGQKSDLWVRVTSGLRRIRGQWFIVHEHVSVPTDFETGKAVLDLKP